MLCDGPLIVLIKIRCVLDRLGLDRPLPHGVLDPTHLEGYMKLEATVPRGREHKPVLDVEAIGERNILQVCHRLNDHPVSAIYPHALSLGRTRARRPYWRDHRRAEPKIARVGDHRRVLRRNEPPVLNVYLCVPSLLVERGHSDRRRLGVEVEVLREGQARQNELGDCIFETVLCFLEGLLRILPIVHLPLLVLRLIPIRRRRAVPVGLATVAAAGREVGATTATRPGIT
mmetsp:Transcript_30087/g.69745  ORF Transcript_30087/g.69745 Transcript_30087/m.69745 type:complete len:230 (+) Transcript_30087:544-1233(+)